MAGNVWEWTRTLWGEDLAEPSFKYPYDPADGRQDLEAPDTVRRVLRGGAFGDDRGFVRCASRSYLPYPHWNLYGFRVCVVSRQD
jgi:iron(II)-dependent oxidoreductase